MKYKGFIIQKDYASDIFRKNSKGEFEARGGYRCRIYADDDKNLQNILVVVEFAYGFELSYDETADVVDLIMEYIDENKDELLALIDSENSISSCIGKTTFQ